MLQLVDHYHELLELRSEAFRRYKKRFVHETSGPPIRIAYPVITARRPQLPFVQVGPWYILDRAPIVPVIEDECRRFTRSIRILEIGPGAGKLAAHLRSQPDMRIASYVGLERDRQISGPYERVDRLEDLAKDAFDVLVASEVFEHMSIDDACTLLNVARTRMSKDAVAVIGTPNPLAPGGIARDATHVQGYPWFDLYALSRLYFEEVDIFRTHYVCTLKRVVAMVPRICATNLLEMDWCEGLIAVCKRPRMT